MDILFLVDSSISLLAQRAQLRTEARSPTGFISAFTAIEGLDIRIGVSSDNDAGFLVPPDWAGADPWFDSTEIDPAAMGDAVSAALGQLDVAPPPAIGCEHVLTSGVDLLAADTTEFVRPDALLVLVLVTDVDDYGAYDQLGGNTCGVGCSTEPMPVSELLASLVDDVKAGEADQVSAIVVAGDPSIAGGLNICEQPASCCVGPSCGTVPACHAPLRVLQHAWCTRQRGEPLRHDRRRGDPSCDSEHPRALLHRLILDAAD